MNLLNESSTGHAGGGEVRPRLPVLFHLLDVSRQRPSRPPAEEPLASLTEMAEPAEAPLIAPPAAEAPLATPAELIGTASIPLATPAAETALSKPNEPARSSPPTPRAEIERRRNAKRPAAEEWFAAHGKYIALVFVLALGLTIYIARVNRRAAAVEEPSDLAMKIEASDSARAKTDTKPSTTVVGDSTSNLASSTASPAKLIETTSASAPQAELFPPTETQVAAKGPPDAAQSSASELFPEKQPDQRLAAQDRGQSAANSLPANAANPAASAPPTASLPSYGSAASPPPATAPPAEPSYPHTGYPATGLPAANYPTTANIPGPAMPAPPAMPQQPPAWPQSPYQPPQFSPTQPPYQPTQFQPAPRPPVGYPPAPPVAGGGNFVPPGGAIPQQYQPPYNPVPGTRYERSGSGLY